jgi:CubicO group peptidase (beta-lactamase class C family)
MSDLEALVQEVAADSGFSGAVRVQQGDQVLLERAFGMAHRGWDIPNAVTTRFATASAAKGFTALITLSLVADGALSLETTARSVLGADLPLIDDAVTVEHLLGHRSGIGDYLDEEELEPDDYVLSVPVHTLDRAEDYLAVLGGFPQVSAPGERFAYNNGAFLVLAILAERLTGLPYHQLAEQRVCRPAGLTHTGFLRSDELPGDTAMGYLYQEGLRTNVLHLPVRGVGDGGLYTTVADVSRFWQAATSGRLIPEELWAEAVRPRPAAPDDHMRYGLGFWLHGSSSAVVLEGADAGISFRSVHDPEADSTWTVVSNTSDGAWPLVKALYARLNPPQ